MISLAANKFALSERNVNVFKRIVANNPEQYILRRNWCGNTYKWQKSYRFTIILGLLRFSALLTFLIADEFWRHHISSGLSILPARAQAELFLLFRIEALKLLLLLNAASSSHVIALWQRCICNNKRSMTNHLWFAKFLFRSMLILLLPFIHHYEMYILVSLETYTTQISFSKTFFRKTFWGCQKLLLLFEGSHSSCQHLVALFVISLKTRLMHWKVQKNIGVWAIFLHGKLLFP